MTEPPDIPADAFEVFTKGMQFVIDEDPTIRLKLAQGMIDAISSPLEGVGPLPLFEFGVEAPNGGNFPHNSFFAGWRYLVLFDGKPFGTATLRPDDDGTKFSRYQEDGFMAQIVKAVGIADEFSEKHLDIKGLLLECRALHFSSVWLTGDPSLERIIPLETMASGRIEALSIQPMDAIKRALIECLEEGSGVLEPQIDP